MDDIKEIRCLKRMLNIMYDVRFDMSLNSKYYGAFHIIDYDIISTTNRINQLEYKIHKRINSPP